MQNNRIQVYCEDAQTRSKVWRIDSTVAKYHCHMKHWWSESMNKSICPPFWKWCSLLPLRLPLLLYTEGPVYQRSLYSHFWNKQKHLACDAVWCRFTKSVMFRGANVPVREDKRRWNFCNLHGETETMQLQILTKHVTSFSKKTKNVNTKERVLCWWWIKKYERPS